MASTPPLENTIRPDEPYWPTDTADAFTKLRCALLNHLHTSQISNDNPFLFLPTDSKKPPQPILQIGSLNEYLLSIDQKYLDLFSIPATAAAGTSLRGKISLWGSIEQPPYNKPQRFHWNIEISASLHDASGEMIRVPRESPYTRGLITHVKIYGARLPLVAGEVVTWEKMVNLLRICTKQVYDARGEGYDDYQLQLNGEDVFFGKVHSFIGNYTKKIS